MCFFNLFLKMKMYGHKAPLSTTISLKQCNKNLKFMPISKGSVVSIFSTVKMYYSCLWKCTLEASYVVSFLTHMEDNVHNDTLEWIKEFCNILHGSYS